MRSAAFVALLMAVALSALRADMAQPPPPPPAAPMPSILQNYKLVDAARLKSRRRRLLMMRRTYSGWGYSPLEQITPANVTRLQPVWSFLTGVTNGHEVPPIVNTV